MIDKRQQDHTCEINQNHANGMERVAFGTLQMLPFQIAWLRAVIKMGRKPSIFTRGLEGDSLKRTFRLYTMHYNAMSVHTLLSS